MVKIKLMKTGRKGQALYRIVAIEARTARDGKYNELLGTYCPSAQPKQFTINKEQYTAWIKKGAQPTATVASLVKKYEKSS